MVPSGSIAGGPGTNVLSPESVMAGTYVPAANQTPQADNVSPWDSDLGRPLRNLYEQLAQQNDVSKGTPTPWNPSQMGGWHMPTGALPPVGINADPALQDPVYGSDLNRPYEDLMAELGQTGGIPAGAGIDQLPPEIMQAAAQGSNGPPGIAEINHALLQAGLPLLDSTGHLTDAIPGYGPSGSTRPMFGQDALLGMPSKADGGYGKNNSDIRQAAMSKIAGPRNISSAIATALNATMPRQQANEAIAQLIADASNEGPITGGTVYDQLIGNQVVTPPSVDQYGRNVPSKLRPDILESMQRLSGNQKREDLRGLADASLLPSGEGQYYQTNPIDPEMLANAQMLDRFAPGLRDLIRARSTRYALNPYSLNVDNTGTSTYTVKDTQTSRDPAAAAPIGAGDVNLLASPPDPIVLDYDTNGEPIYNELEYQGAPPGALVDVNFGGGGGGIGGLKSMALRRIAQPTPKAPISTGKSHIKPGGGKTYSKGAKKSYITNTKTPAYQPKRKFTKR